VGNNEASGKKVKRRPQAGEVRFQTLHPRWAATKESSYEGRKSTNAEFAGPGMGKRGEVTARQGGKGGGGERRRSPKRRERKGIGRHRRHREAKQSSYGRPNRRPHQQRGVRNGKSLTKRKKKKKEGASFWGGGGGESGSSKGRPWQPTSPRPHSTEALKEAVRNNKERGKS